MRISLLMQREPFGEILEKTLVDFFQSRSGISHNIKWYPKSQQPSRSANGQIWLCNPYLNVIFAPHSHKENFEPILAEYSRSTVPWRSPLQRIYCALAIHPLTARFFCKFNLSISPPLSRQDSLIIIGGNHRIRILDREQERCYVINKHQFDSSRTKKEIAFRKQHPEMPIPAILETADNQNWYCEQYVSGTPVNRMKCRKAAEKTESRALTQIKQLATKTASRESLHTYSSNVLKRIKDQLSRNRLLSHNQRQLLQTTAAGLCEAAEGQQAQAETSSISTAQTHGDFQPGNILATADKTWLIDWEYTRRRQSGYDALVYFLKSRSSSSFHNTLQKAVNNDISGLQTWPGLPWENRQQRINSLALFLLEELDLYLEENDNTLFTQLSGGMLTFINTVTEYLKVLETDA